MYNKSMNIKDKFKLFQWLEILIWLLISGLVLFGVKHYSYKKHHELKKYQIFLPDVDGLISGSSVRMMGVPIGYVESVQIVGDEVYVKFVLTEKDVTLPKGVIATVEFNGMAGSKSLEIYPPDTESLAGNKLIKVQSPKRLNDSLGLLCDMFNQIGSMLDTSAYFTKEVTSSMPPVEEISINKGRESLRSINEFIETLSRKRLEILEMTNERIKNHE